MTLKRRQVFQSSINESDSLFLFSKNFLFNSIFIKSEKLFPSLFQNDNAVNGQFVY